MASWQNIEDLQWTSQAFQSVAFNLHTISIRSCQLSSFSYNETQNSLLINIAIDGDSPTHFSQLLAPAAEICKSLKNLEFHDVNWNAEQLTALYALLRSSNIQHITFQNNTFSMDDLSVLSKSLGNSSIRQVMFSESGLGHRASAFLASFFGVNEALEELQIWDDSIGLKGAEELSKIIEVNSTLKLLVIFDADAIVAAPIVSAVLARNRDMEVHIWSREKDEQCSKVVEFAPEKSAMRIYKLDLSGSCRVAGAMEWNYRVTALDMSGIRLSTRWAREFRGVMEHNRTLKHVKLSNTCLKDKGLMHLAAGLFQNSSVARLELDGNMFSGLGIEHLLLPLSKFSPSQNQANVSLKSLTFGGGRTKIGRQGLIALLRLIETNHSLTHLCICNDKKLRQDHFIILFRCLEKNRTLHFLSIEGCKGAEGQKLSEAIMDTLQVNPWIKQIDLTRTGLQIEGISGKIRQKLDQNGMAETNIVALEDMPLTIPKCSQILLCGQQFAGKSTLCSSIAQNFSSSRVPYVDQLKTLRIPVDHGMRTSGIQLRTLHDEDMKITIWDLKGEYELCAFHHLLFPTQGSPSFFLIISSLFRMPENKEPKCPVELEHDILFWIRFIISNSRRTVSQHMLPIVVIVLTHIDKITNPAESLQLTHTLVQKLQERFKTFVEFYQTVFAVDARLSDSVRNLTYHLRTISRTVIVRAPPIFQISYDVLQFIAQWKAKYNKRTMRWDEFCTLCQTKIPELRILSRNESAEKLEIKRRAAANSLHRSGEIIFFEKVGILILDYEWFCAEVLGHLIKMDIPKPCSLENNGFMTRKELEKILRGSLHCHLVPVTGSRVFANMTEDDMVQIMLELSLCYEQEPGDINSPILIPAFLSEGKSGACTWPLNNPEYVYMGRHLACEDSSHMLLSPSFFPRLQIYLHNKIIRPGNQHGVINKLEKSLIYIIINGIHIRVELGGQMGYYVDILGCSKKSATEILRLFQQLIIPSIRSLCCGVTLIESIIRPVCVKNLTPPRHRKTQSVLLQHLKYSLLTVPADSMYDYQHTWSSVSAVNRFLLPSSSDFVRDLLSEDEFHEVVHQRYNDLNHLALELGLLTENSSNHPTVEADNGVDPTLSGIAQGIEAVLKKLKTIEMEFRDLKQEIQGLRYYEHRLLTEIYKKVNSLINFNVQLEERKIPQMFYFVDTQNYTRRLVTSLVSGVAALQLHFLCEFRREIHVIDGQIGCKLVKVDNTIIQSLVPYMSMFMKLLTYALRIGAHVTAGMGHMIPDLSKEVGHIVDPSFACEAAAVGAGALGAVAIGSRMTGRSANVEQTQRAQQWLADFLATHSCKSGKKIAEKFGLWRVRYRDDGQIAWICKWHLEMRSNEIVEVPLS